MPNASSTKQPLRGTFKKRKKAAISSESAGVAAFLCLWRWQTYSLQRGNGTTTNRLFLLHTAFKYRKTEEERGCINGILTVVHEEASHGCIKTAEQSLQQELFPFFSNVFTSS